MLVDLKSKFGELLSPNLDNSQPNLICKNMRQHLTMLSNMISELKEASHIHIDEQ